MKLNIARRNVVLIVISVGLGCVSAWAIERHLSEKSNELESRSRTDKVVRVVAARDLPRGTLINLEDLAKNEFPSSWVGSDSIELSEAHLAQGKHLSVDLKAGQLLMQIHLTERAQPALASRLSPDKRAVTIAVDLLSSMSGLLQPGDRVDLFVSFEYKGQRTTATLLQSVEVLATGQQTRSSSDTAASAEPQFSTVTLAVSHADATKLVAARQGGTITAVLSHETAEPLQANRSVSADHLPGLLGLGIEKGPAPVEVIYGDRLASELSPAGVSDWAQWVGDKGLLAPRGDQ